MVRQLKIPVFVFVIFTLACENLLVNDAPTSGTLSSFEILWDDFDSNYAGFVVRNIDWNAVRAEIYQQGNNASEEELFSSIAEALLSLKDIHTEIVDQNGQRISYTPTNEKSLNEIGPLVNYLESESELAQIFKFGKIKNTDIAYIQISTFASNRSLLQFEMIDEVIQSFDSPAGLILDLRNNGGGEAAFQKTIAKRFITSEFTYYHSQFRNGPEHNDFDDPLTDDISPSGQSNYTGTIIILANRATGSAAELCLMTLKTQGHVQIVGDTTAGGLGFNAWRELPNGWTYRLTTTLTSDKDRVSYEGRGIPPDQVVLFSVEDLENGIDPQLERAIELLR